MRTFPSPSSTLLATLLHSLNLFLFLLLQSSTLKSTRHSLISVLLSFLSHSADYCILLLSSSRLLLHSSHTPLTPLNNSLPHHFPHHPSLFTFFPSSLPLILTAHSHPSTTLPLLCLLHFLTVHFPSPASLLLSLSLPLVVWYRWETLSDRNKVGGAITRRLTCIPMEVVLTLELYCGQDEGSMVGKCSGKLVRRNLKRIWMKGVGRELAGGSMKRIW